MYWPPVVHGVLTNSTQLVPTGSAALGLFLLVPAQPTTSSLGLATTSSGLGQDYYGDVELERSWSEREAAWMPAQLCCLTVWPWISPFPSLGPVGPFTIVRAGLEGWWAV